MKKIILILLFLSIGFISYAQVVFNKVYDFNNAHDGSFEIIQNINGNYVIAANYTDSNSYGIWIINISNQGDTLWTKNYNLSIGGDQPYSITQLTNGEYLLCGGWSDTVTMSANVFLMKLNAQGDSLWMKKYGTAENDYSYSLAVAPDGGFVLAGWSWNTSNPNYADAWVFKTDSLGNLLWQKQFDGYGLDDFFNKVIITPDGNIVCAGVTVVNAVNGKDYVVKLNQNGDTLWFKQFGGTECGETYDINSTSDGGFIGCGGICINGDVRARIYRLDSFGDLIWAKDFARGNGPSEYYDFIAIHELPNGNFMAAGSDYDYTQPVPGGSPRIRMMEFNALGDSIWSKQYTHYGGTNDDYVFDMKLTSDGGYIMCGYIINNSLPQLNDVLVIKVDSNGCDTANCMVGIVENELSDNEILVYPNPTNGEFTISFDDSNFSETTIEVYDVIGQFIFNKEMRDRATTINLTSFSKGIYLVKLNLSGQSYYKKVVKN